MVAIPSLKKCLCPGTNIIKGCVMDDDDFKPKRQAYIPSKLAVVKIYQIKYMHLKIVRILDSVFLVVNDGK